MKEIVTEKSLIYNYLCTIFNATKNEYFNAIFVIQEVAFVFNISLNEALKHYEKWANRY